MIRIHLGNVGSGKTLSIVREMARNPNIIYYTNIIPDRSLKNVVTITGSDIVKREIIGEKPRTHEKIYKYSLNADFWKAQPKPINIVLDEFHSFMNSRKAMSKINIVLSDFLSLIRRIINSPLAEGELIIITQFLGRIDVNAREMASQIRYYREHYIRVCNVHGAIYNRFTRRLWENSDFPKDKKMEFCPFCRNRTMKYKQIIEVWHFGGDAATSAEENFFLWKYKREKRYYDHYYIRDSKDYFNLYDTFQWDNMFSEMY